jgi:subtilase family serine protease
MCQNLIKEINGTRILVEEIVTIVNNSTEKLSYKNEQITNLKEQMRNLIDTTLPVLNTTKSLLNEINVEDLIELK